MLIVIRDGMKIYFVYNMFSRFFPRGKHGVGRIDIVENRFIGMKSRGMLSNLLIMLCSNFFFSFISFIIFL